MNTSDLLYRLEHGRNAPDEKEDAYDEIVRLRRAIHYAMKYCDRDTYEVFEKALSGNDDF